MELRHLRYFTVVAEEQHFGRASQRLGVAQPALSRQIQEIEAELGVALFDRVGRNVRLTDAGRTFLQDAQGVLAQVERATSRAQRASRGQIGTLKVGFSPAMSQILIVARTFAEFRKAFPEIVLDLQVHYSSAQGDALRNREISLGFVYFPPTDFPPLESQPISTTPILLALPKGHRLEHKPKIVLADLRQEPFVWFPREVLRNYCDHVANKCHDGGLTMKVASEAPTEAALLGLIAAGAGISFVLDRGLRYKYVVLREVQDLNADLCAYAIWRRDDSSPVLQSFLSVLRDVLRRGEDIEERGAVEPFDRAKQIQASRRATRMRAPSAGKRPS